MQTQLIPLESSLHGKERRQLRSISKRDLQQAIKYGIKTPGYPSRSGDQRWVFEFADIIYVTDSTCTKEITSYVKPIKLPLFTTTDEELRKFQLHHKAAKQFPEICTSHTVLVIDQSASMNTCDAENFKARSDSVYGHLALEYITTQLDNAASYTDVVSIVEMRSDVQVIYSRAVVSTMRDGRSNPDIFDCSPCARLNPNAVGFAKRERIFGQGAERIVYELREFGMVQKELNFIGERYVAKDNRFRNPNHSAFTNMKFHTVFAKTQHLASQLATEFNRAVANFNKKKTRILFLECFCYVYGKEDGYLVERLIDKDRYRKWNDNRGNTVKDFGSNLHNLALGGKEFDESEFLQDFSHWSYRHS